MECESLPEGDSAVGGYGVQRDKIEPNHVRTRGLGI